MTAPRRRAKKAPLAIRTPPLPPAEPRTQELIGCDEDGNMSLWSVGNVLPMTAFDRSLYGHISGHYVINWKSHAITAHINGFRRDTLIVMFMCSGGNGIQMPFDDVEAMLLGKVIPDPEKEAELLEGFRQLREAMAARNAAPHRRRGRIQ
jgi:hypothetical protein